MKYRKIGDKMICKDCKKKVYIQALSESVCIICQLIIFSPHRPSYIICKQCSEKNNLCQQCGKKIER